MKRQLNYLGVGINLERNDHLRAKLIAEIAEYEHRESSLKTNGSYANFTMIQTYKELIAARRDMLKRLPAIY